ncbi:unnamed protein product [Rhizophagus irregularis]|nr:unnamed protein product [Rhizophagus irregularis]
MYIVVSIVNVLSRFGDFDSKLVGASRHTELFTINISNTLKHRISYSISIIQLKNSNPLLIFLIQDPWIGIDVELQERYSELVHHSCPNASLSGRSDSN